MDTKHKDLSILIVDDDPDLCSILDAGLKEYFVYTEHCLSSAEVFMANHKISLMFLDNSLPDGKGVDFIREVRRQDPNIKIVLMTADPSPELERDAIREGASIFIGKPFKLAAVKNIVDETFMTLSAA